MSMFPKSADVVVVGGGIVGCAIAHYLGQTNLSVVLLDRGGLASGSSGACMGHLMVTPEPSASYAFTSRSVALWHGLAKELGPFEHAKTGALWLAETEDDMELLTVLQQALRGEGDDLAEILEGAALHALEPGLASDLPGAMLYPEDGVVMPMYAAGALAASARANGVSICTHTTVNGFGTNADGSIRAVETSRGTIEAPRVVNACGVWSPDLTAAAGLGRAPIYPRRGDLAITMHHASPVRRQLLEVAYLRVAHGAAASDPRTSAQDPGAHAVNVQPQSNGSCLIGSTRQFCGMRRKVNRELLHTSLGRAARYMPSLRGVPIVRTWAGLRPYTIDHNPILGEVKALPGFYMAAGHEGLGITKSALTGLLIKQMIANETLEVDVSPYAIERFAAKDFADAELIAQGGFIDQEPSQEAPEEEVAGHG